MSRTCDARYCTDDDGRVGFITALVATPIPGDEAFTTSDFKSVPVGHCSDDMYEVWHGMETPAYACGKHAQGMVSASVFRGHRNRPKGVTL